MLSAVTVEAFCRSHQTQQRFKSQIETELKSPNGFDIYSHHSKGPPMPEAASRRMRYGKRPSDCLVCFLLEDGMEDFAPHAALVMFKKLALAHTGPHTTGP